MQGVKRTFSDKNTGGASSINTNLLVGEKLPVVSSPDPTASLIHSHEFGEGKIFSIKNWPIPVDYNRLDNLLRNMQKLERLEFEPEQMSQNLLELLGRRCGKTIRFLDLSNCSSLNDEACEHLAFFSALEEIDLSFVDIRFEGFRALVLGSWKTLKKINLFGQKKLSLVGFDLLTEFVHLKEINLGCSGVRTKSVCGILKKLSASLEKLNIERCPVLMDLRLSAIWQCNHLDELNLSGISITEVGLQLMPKSLKKLNLSSCDSLQAEAFLQFKTIRGLVELDFE
jgi:hypothetical protein